MFDSLLTSYIYTYIRRIYTSHVSCCRNEQ